MSLDDGDQQLARRFSVRAILEFFGFTTDAAASGTASTNTFFRGDNSWAQLHTAPVTMTSATYSVATSDAVLIANRAGTVTVTLPAVASSAGRPLRFTTIQNQTVVSASSNVVPLAGGAAGTAILAGTAGKWADLDCDASNWLITASN